jgi:hypothetical protein
MALKPLSAKSPRSPSTLRSKWQTLAFRIRSFVGSRSLMAAGSAAVDLGKRRRADKRRPGEDAHRLSSGNGTNKFKIGAVTGQWNARFGNRLDRQLFQLFGSRYPNLQHDFLSARAAARMERCASSSVARRYFALSCKTLTRACCRLFHIVTLEAHLLVNLAISFRELQATDPPSPRRQHRAGRESPGTLQTQRGPAY